MYIVHMFTCMYSKQFSLSPIRVTSHCTVDSHHFTSTLLLNVPVLNLQLNGVNSEYNVIHNIICTRMYTVRTYISLVNVHTYVWRIFDQKPSFIDPLFIIYYISSTNKK